MKINRHSLARCLAGAAVLASITILRAAPLTWFPGPSLYDPVSAAATVTTPTYGNVLVGGTAYDPDYGTTYAQFLVATNSYGWGSLGNIYSVNVAGGAAMVDGNLIIYGGTDGTNAQNTVTVVNLSGDTPPTFAPMNTARAYFGYATDRSSLAYAIGGLDINGLPLASVERFNFGTGANGAWSAIASLPAARFNFPAVFDKTNQIYIFGGNTAVGGAEISSVMRYSTARNAWTNLAALPVAVAGSAAALGVDGKIYVVGGLHGGIATNLVQVYNPASNSWTMATPLPENLSASALGVDSLGRLIVMGGADENGNDTTDVWRSQQLGIPDAAPVFTKLPGTNATYLGTYSASIQATGNPQPTYQLVSGPAGMTVDFYTGAISWTPTGLSQIGTNAVTISASNYAGATNWNFAIVVPNVPPAYPTNLMVGNVTENSATLIWNAADPAAGAVTYGLAIPHPWHDPKGSGGGVNYQVIATGIAGTNINISGLKAGTSTTFDISVSGPGGGIGFGFVGFSVNTLPAPPPPNFHVTALTSRTVSLAWDAPVGQFPVVSYSITGWFDGIAAQYPLGFANIIGTTFTVTNLAPGRGMLWSVSATDSAGNVSQPTYLPSLTINPVPVAPQMSAVATMSGGNFQFDITQGGSALQTVFVQATTDFSSPNSWTTIATVFPTNNPFTFADTNAAQFPSRYYRIVAP